MTRRITPSDEPKKEWHRTMLTKDETYALYERLVKMIAHDLLAQFETYYDLTLDHRETVLASKPGHRKYSATEAQILLLTALKHVTEDLDTYPSMRYGSSMTIYRLLAKFYRRRTKGGESKPPLHPREWVSFLSKEK